MAVTLQQEETPSRCERDPMRAPDQNLFWNQILSISEQPAEMPVEEIKARLLAIEEGFSGSFDPVDAFPEYTAIQLCKYFSRVLDKS